MQDFTAPRALILGRNLGEVSLRSLPDAKNMLLRISRPDNAVVDYPVLHALGKDGYTVFRLDDKWLGADGTYQFSVRDARDSLYFTWFAHVTGDMPHPVTSQQILFTPITLEDTAHACDLCS